MEDQELRSRFPKWKLKTFVAHLVSIYMTAGLGALRLSEEYYNKNLFLMAVWIHKDKKVLDQKLYESKKKKKK